MTVTTPTIAPNMQWGLRDITCLTVALAMHALLLLWKGGVITLPNTTTPENALVSVNFMSDVPSYEAPAAPAPKQSLLSKMKSLIRGENNAPKPKVDVFAQKPVAPKPDALEIAKGGNKDVSLVTMPPSIIKAQPNLKQNTFKLATKDAPFKIATVKDQDALANTNAIPIQVGAKTTLSSSSFESAKLPALQSKTFVGHAGSSGQALAMGSASAVQTPALNSALNSNSGSANSNPSKASGKEWAAHSAFAGNSVNTLPRNTVSSFDAPLETSKASNAMKNSDFNISGALRGRPIVQKVFAAYEIDARVALRFRVDWSGRVLDGILVEISSGSPTFDQKVVAALKEWSFSRLPADRANEIQEGVITFVFKGV